MQRQQDFLGALVKKVQSNGVLLDPTRLYPVLDAATSSLTTDAALASLKGLYELVRSTRSIPTDQVRLMTVPRREYRYDPNRDELLQPDADRLFGQLHRDLPVTVKPPPGTEEKAGPHGRRSTVRPGGRTALAVPEFGPRLSRNDGGTRDLRIKMPQSTAGDSNGLGGLPSCRQVEFVTSVAGR